MIHLNSFQKEFISDRNKFVRLVAPAGSGKTLCLLYRAKNLWEINQKEKSPRFLIISFTRAARDELKERIMKDADFAGLKEAVKIETLNQWGYHYLKGVVGPLQIKDTKRDKFILFRYNLRPFWIKRKKFASVIAKNRHPEEIINIFDRLKTIGFFHTHQNLKQHFIEHYKWLQNCNLERYFLKEIYAPLCSIGLIEKNHHEVSIENKAEGIYQFLRFWKECCEYLWESRTLSLDDQKYFALLKLQETYVNRTFPEPQRYQHIIVDEFQDINPLDLFLIKTLQKVNNSSLTIVGDEDQAIFEWRGSTPDFILKPNIYFGGDFITHTFVFNYRCPRNLLYYSQNLISHNKKRIDKRIEAKVEIDAKVSVENFATFDESLNFILKIAEESVRANKSRDMAIIGRKKNQIIPIQMLFVSKNITYYAKEDINILLSEAFSDLKKILSIIPKVNEGMRINEIVDYFLCFCKYVRFFPLRKAEQKRLTQYLYRCRPNTFSQALSCFSEYKGPIYRSTEEEIKLDFIIRITKVITSRTVSEAILEISNELEGLQQNYIKAEDDIYYKEPPFAYLIDFAKRYGNNFMGFVKDLEETIERARASLYIDEENPDSDYNLPIHIMTAYRAKGKEFNTVIVLEVNDGIWPIVYAETEDEKEEERRLFYVAITRARERLILLPVTKVLGTHSQESPYLYEMGILKK